MLALTGMALLCARRGNCQPITAIMSGVVRMSAHPCPANYVSGSEFIQLDPEVLVGYIAAGRSPPSVLFPSPQIFCDAALQVLRVGHNLHCLHCASVFFDNLKRFDGRSEFHTIIRGVRITPNKFPLPVSGVDNTCPSTRSWIAQARAIRDCVKIACHLCFLH